MQTAKDRTTGNNKPTALYRSYNWLTTNIITPLKTFNKCILAIVKILFFFFFPPGEMWKERRVERNVTHTLQRQEGQSTCKANVLF